jgi:two-component system, NarL family, nitrate/nitrite response regulator NarL
MRREQRPRVALTVDIGLYRDALARALPRCGLTVVSRDDKPDVLLVDVSGSGGIDALAQAARRIPDTRLLAIAVRNRDRDVLACIEAGAVGYVLRGASVEALADAVQRALRDEPLAPPHLIATLMRRVATLSANGGRSSVNALTSRELEVVELIEKGLSNKEIAAQLSIAVTTVKNHVHSILEKLKVQRRGEAASLLRRTSAG